MTNNSMNTALIWICCQKWGPKRNLQKLVITGPKTKEHNCKEDAYLFEDKTGKEVSCNNIYQAWYSIMHNSQTAFRCKPQLLKE